MTILFPGLGQIAPLQLVGILGFCCYVTSYTCLSFGFLTSDHIRYYVLNTLAALLVMTSLAHEFNLASAMIQTFWITIGCVAIALRLFRRRRARRRALRGVGQTHDPVVPRQDLHPRRPRESQRSHALQAATSLSLSELR